MSKIIDTIKKVGEKITPDGLFHKQEKTVDVPLPIKLQSVVVEDYNRLITALEEDIRFFKGEIEVMKRNGIIRIFRKSIGILIEVFWYCLAVVGMGINIWLIFPLLNFVGSGTYLIELVKEIPYANLILNIIFVITLLIPFSFFCIGLIFRKIRKRNNQIVILINLLNQLILKNEEQLEKAKATRLRIINSLVPEANGQL